MGRVALATVLTALIIAASLTSITHQASARVPTKVFSMSDPLNDDSGYGTCKYPASKSFLPGALDLKAFTVVDAESYVEFVVNVSTLGNNTLNLPNGFDLQEIQIYVHTSEGVGAVRTYGLNLNLRSVDRWQFAIIATGLKPDANKFSEGKASTALIFWNGTASSKLTVRTSGNSIIISVPKSAISEWIDNIKNWRYFVALTPFNPNMPYGVMKFSVEATNESVGGCDPAAVKAGVQPQVMDILAPNVTAQSQMLKSFNPHAGIYSEIAAVPYVKGFGLPSPAGTVTHTKTKTETFTKYVYGTTTITKPVFQEYYGVYTWVLLSAVFVLLLLLAYSLQRGRR
ncbi:MAG: hypothetical protein J7L55_03825 [Desulfurococcales archaeon]|nr:hypothetical protein [Desulfurococcales archaeon]